MLRVVLCLWRQRAELQTTRQELLSLRGYEQCQQHNAILQRGLKVRCHNPRIVVAARLYGGRPVPRRTLPYFCC